MRRANDTQIYMETNGLYNISSSKAARPSNSYQSILRLLQRCPSSGLASIQDVNVVAAADAQ